MSNCENCNHETTSTPESISYIAFEAVTARMERSNKRLTIALIISIIITFISNAMWLYSWMQYDYISEEITVESADGGNANYIGQDGDIYNGTNNSAEEKTDAKEQPKQGNTEA